MAVFREELNWSTYQDRQLQVLQSLERSFGESLKQSRLIGDSLTRMKNSIDSMVQNTNVLATTVSAFYDRMTRTSETFSRSMNDAATSMNNMTNTVNRTRTIYDQHGNIILDIDQREQAREENRQRQEEERIREDNIRRRAESERQRELEGLHRDQVDAHEKFIGKLIGWGDALGKYANEFSTVSNSMIKVTGASGSQVNDFRETLVHDIVAGLNMDTGGFYDSQKAYQQMVSFANGTGVGNMETLRVIARPLLLANASMDANISDLAKILGKWSTRYNFSSLTMESLVDEIRGNTANNQATAQETLENLSKLESWVGYYAGGNEEKMSIMADSISKGTSWLESMNVNSARYTEYIDAIASGKAASDTQLIQVLHAVGLSAMEAQQMFAEGNIDKLYEALFSGEVNIMSGLRGRDTRLIAQTLESMGMDMSMVDAYTAAMSQGYKSLGDFELTTSDQTAAESVEEQYVSMQDKANHWLQGIHEILAGMQETIGFGLSDIAGLYVLGKGATSAIKGIATLLGVPGAEGLGGPNLMRRGLTAGGGNLFGSSSRLAGLAGGLVGAGGVVAGLGGAVYGIGKGANQIEDGSTGLGAWNILGGTAMGLGSASLTAGMLGVGASNFWNPLGWGALVAGGATLVGTSIYESMDTVSGASASLESQFEDLSDSFHAEHFDRIEQLESLKESIAATTDFEEAAQLVANSGLVSLEDTSYNTTQELINMISYIQETSSSLMSLNDAALEAAQAIVAEKAAEDDDKIKSSIQDYVKGITGEHGSLTKKDDEYYVIKQLFTQLASSIKDDTARKEALADVESIFSDNSLSSDELAFLTDTGGSSLALFSTELDRKDNLFRQERDLSKANSALSLIGISGYDLSGQDAATQLSTIYSKWVNAKSSSEKEEYAAQYAAIYNGLDSNLKSAYRTQAKSLGINSYDRGSNYITSDQLALIHEGEAIIPKKYNPMANLNELETLREKSRKENEETNRANNAAMGQMIAVLTEIQGFLAEWKKDNETQSKINAQKSKFSAERTSVASYGASLSSKLFL